jgi:class 3 adenylate cyclase
MGLLEDLRDEVKSLFRQTWTTRDGIVVPDDASVTLKNDGILLDATVLYADIDESTSLVDAHTPSFVAEVYKAFLLCAAKIIRNEGGEITAYDGDRVMAVFVGSDKNTSAARTALRLNYARIYLVNAELKAFYGDTKYHLRHVVGVDTSSLLVAKTGVRGANDLVWVGTAANYAAKLCQLPADHSAYITADVFDKLHESAKYHNDGTTPMWEQVTWNANGRTIYRSNWWWSFA